MRCVTIEKCFLVHMESVVLSGSHTKPIVDDFLSVESIRCDQPQAFSRITRLLHADASLLHSCANEVNVGVPLGDLGLSGRPS